MKTLEPRTELQELSRRFKPLERKNVEIVEVETKGKLSEAISEYLVKKKRERYEYRCPYCGYVNIRYEKAKRIVCDRCKRAFYAK